MTLVSSIKAAAKKTSSTSLHFAIRHPYFILMFLVFGILLGMACYTYSDSASSLLNDFGAEAFSVDLMSKGQKIYVDFIPSYGLLGYWFSLALQVLFHLTAFQAVQLYFSIGVWASFILFCAIIFIYLHPHQTRTLTALSLAVFFHYTFQDIHQGWSLGNPVYVLSWMLFMLILASQKLSPRAKFFSSVILACICILARPSNGYVMLAASALYYSLAMFSQPLPLRMRLSRLLLDGLLALAFSLFILELTWGVLVSPQQAMNRQNFYFLFPYQYLVQSSSRLISGWNYTGWFFHSLLPEIDPATILESWNLGVYKSYLIDFILKLGLVSVCAWNILKKIFSRPFRLTALTEREVILIVFSFFALANISFHQHILHGVLDLPLTITALVVSGVWSLNLTDKPLQIPLHRILSVSTNKTSSHPLKIRYVNIRWAVLASQFINLVFLLVCAVLIYNSVQYYTSQVVYKEYETENLVFRSDLEAYYSKNDIQKVRSTYRIIHSLVPNIEEKKIWLIDPSSGLQYALGAPLSVKSMRTASTQISPATPWYSDYVRKLRKEYFDYILIRRDWSLFNRGGTLPNFIGDAQAPPTTNLEILDLIQQNYSHYRDVPGMLSLDCQLPLQIWRANRLHIKK